MDRMDFYTEKKWCNRCKKYVFYLMSVKHSYCVECGEPVTLFDEKEKERFHKLVEKNKYKAS